MDKPIETNSAIKQLVILGGGTAGWMSAALLARKLTGIKITLVESEEIGAVGVGEATVPIIQSFNRMLGIDERDFIRATQGSFKLGIRFDDWGWQGNSFFHGFGDFGVAIDGVSPYQYWLRLKSFGDPLPLSGLSFGGVAASHNKFCPPPSRHPLAAFQYAYHFDAGLYARFLREYAERLGVERIDAKVEDVELDSDTGDISCLKLAGGKSVQGDFFIDCSGFRSLLLGEVLGIKFVDWTHWLPCDRAVVAACERTSAFTPFTISRAQTAGWQWRIPLQQRVGNGYVYSSQFISDQDALDEFVSGLESVPLNEPRMLLFRAGHREQFWSKNCVAIGLSAGFLEPLESTSIQLIQNSLARLLEILSSKHSSPLLVGEFNRLTCNEYERVRDFIILHYLNSKREEPLWRYSSAMDIPQELSYKMALFKELGRVPMLAEESYSVESWISIFNGLNIVPSSYQLMAANVSEQALHQGLAQRVKDIKSLVKTMPEHSEFIHQLIN